MKLQVMKGQIICIMRSSNSFGEKTPLKTCKNEIAGNERSDYLHNALV